MPSTSTTAQTTSNAGLDLQTLRVKPTMEAVEPVGLPSSLPLSLPRIDPRGVSNSAERSSIVSPPSREFTSSSVAEEQIALQQDAEPAGAEPAQPSRSESILESSAVESLLRDETPLEAQGVPAASIMSSDSVPEQQSSPPTEEQLPWKQCHVHRPSLQELRSQSFSDYVRSTVLKAARPRDDSDDDVADAAGDAASLRDSKATIPTRCNIEDADTEPCHLDHGMAKVVLPPGFLSLKGIANDPTARGPNWQKGTPLGDYVIASPMHQHIRGLAGTYSYALMDQPARTVSEFREQADRYRDDLLQSLYKKQHNNKDDPNNNPPSISALERHFWKRLGPTMPPSMYGADQEGTMFHPDDEATGWSLGQLDSCLHVLGHVPGVTSPYLYFGMWASVFCVHTEDMNLLSINYLHAGAPKIWYGISNAHAARFQTLASGCFCLEKCGEFLRHKQSMISPQVLQKAGIPFTFMVQYPGEAVITFPGAYHFGFNSGFNIAEATNFAVPEWIPFGRQAKVCLCRPDSVRIDMDQFCRLLNLYQTTQKSRRRGARLSWKAWGESRRPKPASESEDSDDDDESEMESVKPSSKSKPKQKLSDQQRKKEFWVEVMKPVTKKNPNTDSHKSPSSKSKAKRKAPHEKEVWHLAKPVQRKQLRPELRVLVILPAKELGGKSKRKDLSDDEGNDADPLEVDDEQCFAGRVVEIADNHVRVHFDGLNRTDDVWVPMESSKIFVDGGRWDEEADKAMPALHFWQEMDSKRRCFGE